MNNENRLLRLLSKTVTARKKETDGVCTEERSGEGESLVFLLIPKNSAFPASPI